MQHLRDLLRSSLRTSLAALLPLDRLAAAWPVVAGHAIAERSAVAAFDGSTAVVHVTGDRTWLAQLRSMTPQLRGDLAKVSGIPLTDILFLAPDVSPRSRPDSIPHPRVARP